VARSWKPGPRSSPAWAAASAGTTFTRDVAEPVLADVRRESRVPEDDRPTAELIADVPGRDGSAEPT